MAYVHITSAGANAVSFSICAKCGSTSLFHSLFKAVYGTTYADINKIRNTNQKGPWVQQWWKWPESGRPDGSLLMYAGHLQTYPGITWMHFHVYRDPVRRVCFAAGASPSEARASPGGEASQERAAGEIF